MSILNALLVAFGMLSDAASAAASAETIAIVPSGRPVVLAQAGMVGGTIGKTDKSVIGSDQPAAKPRPAPSRKRPARGEPRVAANALTAASLRGNWRVTTTCFSGADSLRFIIRETSTTSFAGDYEPGGGKIVSGTIDGSRITIVTSSTFTVTWTGTVSRSGSRLRIDGGYTPGAPPGNCQFAATKG